MPQSFIRPTTQKDLHVLATAYVDLYKYLNMGEQWNITAAEKLLSYYFEKFPELAYTAKYDGKIVGGFLSAVKPWWDGYHLFDGEIFVHHHFQMHGLGRALLKAVFTALKNIIKQYPGTFLRLLEKVLQSRGTKKLASLCLWVMF